MTFQVGAYAGQTRSMSINSVNSSQLGLANGTATASHSLALIDVTDRRRPRKPHVLDKAIADVSTLRATLGSAQKNTFESAINSLSVASENISASESTIRDTDMAAEMVNFTKNQIMQQAGVLCWLRRTRRRRLCSSCSDRVVDSTLRWGRFGGLAFLNAKDRRLKRPQYNPSSLGTAKPFVGHNNDVSGPSARNIGVSPPRGGFAVASRPVYRPLR